MQKSNEPVAYNMFNNPVDPGTTFTGPGRTKQSFKDECDIKNIMKKYRNTGVLGDPLRPGTRKPLYGNFIGVKDYHQAQIQIAQASEQFDALPGDLRKRFRNDPAEMLEFVNNPNNKEEAIKLGLLPKEPEKAVKQPEKPVESKKTKTTPKGNPVKMDDGGEPEAVE